MALSVFTLLVMALSALTAGNYLACKKLSGRVLTWLSAWVRCRFAYGPADATATHCLLLQ